jgi:hypothetical protein
MARGATETEILKVFNSTDFFAFLLRRLIVRFSLRMSCDFLDLLDLYYSRKEKVCKDFIHSEELCFASELTTK